MVFYNIESRFIFDQSENEGEIIPIYGRIRSYLNIDDYNELSDIQKHNFLESIKAYVFNNNLANREEALEIARKRLRRKLPSRIWLTDTNCIEFWLRTLVKEREYQLFEVETDYDPFVSRDKLLPDESAPVCHQIRQAKKYWTPTEEDLRYAYDKEYLYTGVVHIKRRIK